MIRAVRCDHPEFRAIEFERGFNVIMAERTATSTEKDSRNGVGKTTLIKIIDFCLGAGTQPNQGLRVRELDNWTFILDLEIRGKSYSVARNTSEVGYVVFDAENDWSDWPIKPEYHPKTNEAIMKVSEWTRLLGWLLFDLPITKREKYAPSFRSLISYFVRSSDGYANPFQHNPRQDVYDIQANNAYLLDLNWSYVQQWGLLKDRKTAIDNLKRLTKTGSNLVSNLLGSIGALENDKARLERQIYESNEQLNNFRVHPQYEQIEKRANRLTLLMHDLKNGIINNNRLIEFYESNLNAERTASDNQVAGIYRQAGVDLPNTVVKRLEDVQQFHNQITQNRRDYLRSEINRMRVAVTEANQQLIDYDQERSTLMKVLEEHGALAELTRLREIHFDLVAKLDEVNTRISNLRKIEREISTIKIEREQLLLRARADYDERVSIREARSIFNSNSETLYEAPGDFIINISDTGYKFRVDIKRDGSDGIDKMKIFCYDLMLAELWAKRPVNPGFLIHDSTIFADVDERQIAKALQLAAEKSQKYGFQYIVMLNSDKIPYGDFDIDFDLESYIRLRLTDDTVEGSLLGIRF